MPLQPLLHEADDLQWRRLGSEGMGPVLGFLDRGGEVRNRRGHLADHLPSEYSGADAVRISRQIPLRTTPTLNGLIRVLYGKCDPARTVGLDDGAWGVLEVWRERKRSLGLSGHRR